jgi:Na+/phosphate symporter
MKDKRVFFNPIRMISPKLDAETLKLENLHEHPVSENLTLEEGLLVMLSKLIEMSRLVRLGFLSDCPDEILACESLGKQVHEQEKLLTSNLACALTDPIDMCRTIILFPGHLERIGDFLEGILNCCRVKTRDSVTFSEKALFEIDDLFKFVLEMMRNLRDSVVAPNKYLLTHIISEEKRLDQLCQDLQMAHVDRLLQGVCTPRGSSLYLDILESIQSLMRHVRTMAEDLLNIQPEKA